MTLDNQNISDIELKTYAKTNKHTSGMKLRFNEPVKEGLDLSHKDEVKAILEHEGQRTEEANLKAYDTKTGIKVYVPADTAYEIDCPEGEVVKVYVLEVNPNE